MPSLHPTALVIGAGPAGLMAAEVLSNAGCQVTLAEQKPTAARKFLMAGKSGLNLTKQEDLPTFIDRYPSAPEALRKALAAFGPSQVQAWAQGLGQDVFTGSSGKVFPNAMKASPLLRAWLSRLSAQGVVLQTRWCWQPGKGPEYRFTTPLGPTSLTPDLVVLALGGASWARLGSDGGWSNQFDTAAFEPSNMGLRVNWSPYMERHFGKPVKGIALTDGQKKRRGECVISRHGLEGSLIYDFSASIRAGRALRLDLKPDLDPETIQSRLAKVPAKTSQANVLRKALRLSAQSIALWQEWSDGSALRVEALKSLPIRDYWPAPLDEAISTAGGLRMSSLQGFRIAPRLYTAGEMLDWDAPTGGYLITACLATGRAAALQALDELF